MTLPRYANLQSGPAQRFRNTGPDMFAGSTPALGTDKLNWLGRQLADYPGLNPGMLWVQLPPEPLDTTRPRGAARSARLPVTQEIVGSNPIGGA